jgi:hypothetical protein
MRPKIGQMAAAAAIVGFLGFGGVTLAYAQDSTTTTPDPSATTTAPDDGSGTTTAPDSGSTTPPDHSSENCPNMGEGGGRGPRGQAPGETPSPGSTETPSQSEAANV